MSSATGVTLIAGCGFTGLALAQRLTFAGRPVIGTTRTAEKASHIRSRGAEVMLLDTSDLSPLLKARGRIENVVCLIPPRMDGATFVDHTAALIEIFKDAGLKRFVYVSSTSVYGDHAGEAVTETSPCQPLSPRGKARLAIEQQVLASTLPAMVVRPAGIYGPGRSMLHRLTKGTMRLIDHAQAISNRTHVSDLALLIDRCLTHGTPGATYLACDERPRSRQDLTSEVVREFGLAAPTLMSLQEAQIRLSPDVFHMMTDSKRLDATWTRESLGFRLRYPNFMAGAREIWQREGAQLSA